MRGGRRKIVKKVGQLISSSFLNMGQCFSLLLLGVEQSTFLGLIFLFFICRRRRRRNYNQNRSEIHNSITFPLSIWMILLGQRVSTFHLPLPLFFLSCSCSCPSFYLVLIFPSFPASALFYYYFLSIASSCLLPIRWPSSTPSQPGKNIPSKFAIYPLLGRAATLCKVNGQPHSV